MRATLLAAALLALTSAAARADEGPPPHEGGVQVKLGGQPDPLDVIGRLPPDVRGQLNGEQIEDILRRSQEAQTATLASTLVPSVFFATILGIVIIVAVGRYRRDRQLHDTLRAMIEKGVEIPAALIVPEKAPKPDDRRRGIILVAVGIGVGGFLFVVARADNAWALGLVPLLLGVGYLVAWGVERKPTA